MKSRSDKPSFSKRFLFPIFFWSLFVILFLSGLLWYMSRPPEAALSEPRWTEDNVGLDVTAEERAVESQLPGFKQSRALEIAEQKRQAEREEAIRQEEREKALQEVAAAEAKAKAEEEAKRQEAAEEASQDAFDREVADYETALYFFQQELDAQLGFLTMQMNTIEADPSYIDTMDFAVSMDEGARTLYDIHDRMYAIVPPSSYSDFHMMYTDGVLMMANGISKINDGVSFYDYELIEEGVLDWGMAVNHMQRAVQAAPW